MTDTGVLDLPLPDASARALIAGDLDTNLLVEAGAGSGKTTELVSRMTALVASGRADIDEIAAVTFTRKAAGELRQRFQIRMEKELRDSRADPASDVATEERLRVALENIDRAFVGTIHSFCARLLRERPLEIGLDPGFQELAVEERIGLRDRFWESYLERLTRDSDPMLEELATAGVRPTALSRAFEYLVENPDVDFPAEDSEPPAPSELGPIRDELDAVVDLGWELMPEREPSPKWDSLQLKLRELHFTRDVTGWKEPVEVFEALGLLCKPGPSVHRIVQKRWRDKGHAKALCERINAFFVGDGPANRLVERWYAHRYALVIRLGRHAAREYAEHRRRIGRLDFQDLLVLTARLLRSNALVRGQLGERYRYLLVDEFQDTDPLQAEIVLLLASDPSEDSQDSVDGDPPDEIDANIGRGSVAPGGLDAGKSEDDDEPLEDPGPDWRVAAPRPGALFVVGDPKQSIYRFRRADIQLYSLVKERFTAFGKVVELTTNFRSRPAIGDLVNEHFLGPDFFPERATAEQASFESLNTRPPTEPVPSEGVFTYEIEPQADNKAAAAVDDAGRIGTWIRARIDAGEREAGDFMILTRTRSLLATYARALEARSVPVQVTGAGVRAEEEIRELEVVLECMIDPANSVKVVAALVGLFFGMDYDQLVSHRLDGGSFDAMRPLDRGHPEVLRALRALNRWWSAAKSEPADIFVSRLVDELGLLPYAAAGDLGSLRAGALVYALDAVRAAALGGEASLPGALAALRAALELAEAEAPLEPGRKDVVRLMNLHQAKGLEAKVVVLADPSRMKEHEPSEHTARRPDGGADGYLKVTEPTAGFGSGRTIAKPIGWEEKGATELRFSRAEEVRLAYVAVTRAREELVVARWPGGKNSPWASLDPWLDERATVLDLEVIEPRAREHLEMTPEDAERLEREAAERCTAMAEPSFRFTSVTELAKGDGQPRAPHPRSPAPSPDAGFRGLSWGSVVHGALAEAAQEGVGDDGLRATCRDLLVEYGRPLDDHGEPTELAELIELVHAVRASKLWRRALSAERHLVEVPFATTALPVEPASRPEGEEPRSAAPARRQLDLFSHAPGPETEAVPAPAEDETETGVRVLEGVIDLAFREPDGWVIADYKTDIGTDPDFGRRSEGYRRQVDLYAEAWAALTGERVKERVLFYTTQGRVESW